MLLGFSIIDQPFFGIHLNQLFHTVSKMGNHRKRMSDRRLMRQCDFDVEGEIMKHYMISLISHGILTQVWAGPEMGRDGETRGRKGYHNFE
jgi:hypothetical protein